MKITSHQIEHKDRKDEYGSNLWEHYLEIESDGVTFILHVSEERGLDRVERYLIDFATSLKVKGT